MYDFSERNDETEYMFLIVYHIPRHDSNPGLVDTLSVVDIEIS